MYSPVAAPRQRRSSISPQPKSSFQRELEATMKQRRARGLAADVSPRDSDDELASDDDLMADFNMTSKNRSPSFEKASSKSSVLDTIFGKNKMEDKSENLNKTWKPPGYDATSIQRRGSKLAGSEDEDDSDEKAKKWKPPGHKRNDSVGSNAARHSLTTPEPRASPRTSPRASPRSLRAASRNSNPVSSEPRPRPRLKLKSASYSSQPIRASDKLAPLKGDPLKPPISPRRPRFWRSRSETPKSQLEKGENRLIKPQRGVLSDSEDSDSDEIKKTLLRERKSPFSQKSQDRGSVEGRDRKGSLSRNSPHVLRDSLEEGDHTRDRKSPFERLKSDRKSPHDEATRSRQGSRQSNDGKQNGERSASSLSKRDSETRFSRQNSKERTSPLDATRKSPFEASRRRSKVLDSDEDSEDAEDSRDKAALRRVSREGRSSVTFEEDHQPRRTPTIDRKGQGKVPLKPALKSRTTEDGDRPTLQRQRAEEDASKSAFRPIPKPRHQTETSSVCDEMEKEPNRSQKVTPESTSQIAKKGAKTEKQLLEQVIDSVDGAQGDNRIKLIEGDSEKDKKKDAQRPKSGKLHKPKPRYASGGSTPNLNDSLNGTFNSTTDIREAVYRAWLLEREEKKKQEMKEKIRKEKEAEEKKRKEEEEKKLESTASFRAWMESKKDFGKDKIIAKRKEEKKMKKEAEEKIEKKTEAELAFRSWKEEKDKRIKEELKKKKKAEEEEKRKKQEEQNEKVKDSENAFKGWKSKKDKVIVHNQRNKKKEQENNKQEEEYAKTLREEESMESYQTWLARKEKQQEKERREKMRRKRLEEEEEFYKQPWSPAGRTIPVGR